MGLVKPYRELVLPVSQVKLTLKELRAYDYGFIGAIPDSFTETKKRQDKLKADGAAPVQMLSDFKPDELMYIAKRACRAIVRVHHKPGEIQQEIVAKNPGECSAAEFSFFDLPSEDQTALVADVFGREAGADEAPAFPGDKEPGDKP